METRVRCLILDHDDTVVDSTAVVHYPSFVQYMNDCRGGTDVTLREYLEKNFDPGIYPFFREELGFSEAEMLREQEYWNDFVQNRVPRAFGGIRELLEKQRAAGGYVTVVSHSLRENILRDWRENGLGTPDLTYGWEVPRERRKPRPDCVFEILETLGLRPEEALVIDDLKPGWEMARASGVPFAAAGWAYDIPGIEGFMRRHSDRYFKTVREMDGYLFGDDIRG